MMNRFTTLTKRFILAAALFAIALPALAPEALAASSDWIGTRGGKLRLVALPPDAQGIIRGFLEIAPDDGWHTYWKVPGSGGVPPQVSLKDGGNVRLERLDFPAPRILGDGNLRDFGYDSRVMLPLTLRQEKPGAPSTLSASIFIGLCSDICVPFQADVFVKVGPEDKPKPAEVALVSAANALLPEAPGADFAVEEAHATEDGQGVILKLRLPPGATPSTTELVLVGPDGQVFGKAKPVSSQGGALTMEARLPGAKNGALVGKHVDLLLLSAGRAMETDLPSPERTP